MLETYMIVCKDSGKAILELPNDKLINKVNTDRYKVLTAMEYLRNLNQNILCDMFLHINTTLRSFNW